VIWGKVCTFLALYMVVRWTLPRFRFDQIMRLCWKGLVPMGLAVVVVQALLIAFGLQIDPAKGLAGNFVVVAVSLVANGLVLLIALAIASQSRAPISGRQENLPGIVVKPARAES